MKRHIVLVVLSLLTGMLVSCGGGGDGGSSGSSSTPISSNPGSGTGSEPGSGNGGDPGSGNGGDPGSGNGGNLPPAGTRVEETDTAVVRFSAGWTAADSRAGWSGGAALESNMAGATVSVDFVGTSVRWIGRRSPRSGIALVRVDGGTPVEVDLFARVNEIRAAVHTIGGLSDGKHTLTIEVTGRQHPFAESNVVVVDAFDVQPQILSRFQETDPDDSVRTDRVNWRVESGVTLTGTGWTHDAGSAWSGGGVQTGSEPKRGGMRFTEVAGDKATVKFRGTSIAWSGYRGPDAGIARVQVDGGEVAEIDLYSPRPKFQIVVFTKTGLADAKHTLTIEATGRKNAASTGARVVLDAFEVTIPGRRYQEDFVPANPDDPRITYIGAWERSGTDRNVNRPWSEGASFTSNVPGARAKFEFTGTSVSWIGCQKASIGAANIYLDGVLLYRVSNSRVAPASVEEPGYTPGPSVPGAGEGYQRTIYRVDGLTPGRHTLEIEVASNGYVVIDAFDVHP